MKANSEQSHHPGQSEPERREPDPSLAITIAGFYSAITNVALYNADFSSRVGIGTAVGLGAYAMVRTLNNPKLTERLDT